MIGMNSVLTVEERILLQSLECEDTEKVTEVLGELKTVLLKEPEIFSDVVILSEKLENERIDYFYEMIQLSS